jgi:hypothetical protein
MTRGCERLQRRDSEQADRASPDHQHALAGRRHCRTNGVYGTGEGFDENGFFVCDGITHADELRLVRDEHFPPAAAKAACRADEHPGWKSAVGESGAPRVMASRARFAGRLESTRLAAEEGIGDDAVSDTRVANTPPDLEDLADVLMADDERKR